jgi:hypothetical protein
MSTERDPADPGAEIARPENLDDGESVSCKVCMKEVPRTEARSAEGRDYVWYFCGLDCFEAWERHGSGA